MVKKPDSVSSDHVVQPSRDASNALRASVAARRIAPPRSRAGYASVGASGAVFFSWNNENHDPDEVS